MIRLSRMLSVSFCRFLSKTVNIELFRILWYQVLEHERSLQTVHLHSVSIRGETKSPKVPHRSVWLLLTGLSQGALISLTCMEGWLTARGGAGGEYVCSVHTCMRLVCTLPWSLPIPLLWPPDVLTQIHRWFAWILKAPVYIFLSVVYF